MNIQPKKPLYSGEIRWFSKDSFVLSDIYESLPGESVIDSERSDYYLKVNGVNTGVKLREGKHEIKTLLAFEAFELGDLETWSKWSYKEEDLSILHKVRSDMLTDWVRVDKKRWKKKYEILENYEVRYNNSRLNHGCGVEYTELKIGNTNYYTFGLESFAFVDDAGNQDFDRVLINLKSTLNFLNIDKEILEGIDANSYPSFLTTVEI